MNLSNDPNGEINTVLIFQFGKIIEKRWRKFWRIIGTKGKQLVKRQLFFENFLITFFSFKQFYENKKFWFDILS